TQTTTLVTGAGDIDSDNVIDPGIGGAQGDKVLTTVTITNNSTNTDATGVTFSETLAGMTIVDQTGNDVNVSPLAFNDKFDAIGNTTLHVGGTAGAGPELYVNANLFSNDVEFFGDTKQ